MFLVHGVLVISNKAKKYLSGFDWVKYGRWGEHFIISHSAMLNAVLLIMVFILVFRSSQLNIYQRFILKDKWFYFIGILLLISLLQLNITPYSKFIYFNF